MPRAKKETGSPFTIVIDSREQTPWVFGDDQPVEVKKLDAGDYSIVGFETTVTVERKTLNDFVGTVIAHRKRFSAELDRMASYSYRLIVVEANVSDIINQTYTSKAYPMSVLGAALAIKVYRNIPVCFWGSRQSAQVLAAKWLGMVWKKENA